MMKCVCKEELARGVVGPGEFKGNRRWSTGELVEEHVDVMTKAD
jgi:hypothetical protein